MPKVKILTQSDLMKAVPLDNGAVACVENAFAALAGGKVVMPPILSLAIKEANGEVDVKTASDGVVDALDEVVEGGPYDVRPEVEPLLVLCLQRVLLIVHAQGVAVIRKFLRALPLLHVLHQDPDAV